MNAVLIIAYRDILKFLRDRSRIVASVIFPVVFIGILGGSINANIKTPYNSLAYIFTGVYAQTLFQSAALGMVSLIEDRENDFTQVVFISPVSRYAIIWGKILGESLVSMVQGIAVLAFGAVIGIPMPPLAAVSLLVVGMYSCIVGAAFGLLVLSRISSRRAADQIFPFVFLPQLILAGLFSPIKHPWFLVLFSYFAPLRYAADLTRNLYYRFTLNHDATVELWPPWANIAMIIAITVACLVWVRSCSCTTNGTDRRVPTRDSRRRFNHRADTPGLLTRHALRPACQHRGRQCPKCLMGHFSQRADWRSGNQCRVRLIPNTPRASPVFHEHADHRGQSGTGARAIEGDRRGHRQLGEIAGADQCSGSGNRILDLEQAHQPVGQRRVEVDLDHQGDGDQHHVLELAGDVVGLEAENQHQGRQ